jgi:glycosyltransferase involved in cell wall biosynthesis
MLSVLLATHNGADTIGRTLAAMAEMTQPPEGWLLVVVNNASTDATEAEVLRWRERLPLRYFVEPRLGKSFAINAALEHARGDLIVMTDDDVLPAPDWLTELRRVADAYPQCAILGGAIVPAFEGGQPSWPMPQWCRTVLYGETPTYAEGEIGPENVSGANMTIRRSLHEQGWRFREEFLVGEHGLMGEDSDFVRRAVAAGHRVAFAPTASVRHIIRPRQSSLIWMQHRFIRHGRSMVLIEGNTGGAFPRWRVRAAATAAFGVALAAVRQDRARMFELMTAAAYHVGALCQSMAPRRSPASG